MGLIVRFFKFLSRSYQRRVDGTYSAQIAYQVLQRGVRRRQESNILLTAKELSLVQSCRNRLILSAVERELLEDSEDAVSRVWVRNARLGMGTIVLLAFTGVVVFAVYSSGTLHGEDQENAMLVNGSESKQIDDASPLKINQPPRKDPSPQKPAVAKNPLSPSPSLGSSLLSEEKELESPPVAEPEPVEKSFPEIDKSVEKTPVPEPPAPEKAAARNAAATTPLIATPFGSVQILKKGGKAGIAKADGRFLLPPEYDNIQVFNRESGLFRVTLDGKEGLAYAGGELLLYPFFEKVYDYVASEKVFVIVNEGKYGLYDEERREFVAGFEFLKICCYSEGLFGVQRDNGRWGFINREGEAVILSMYESIKQPFKDGRAVVQKDGREIQIDRNGNAYPL